MLVAFLPNLTGTAMLAFVLLILDSHVEANGDLGEKTAEKV